MVGNNVKGGLVGGGLGMLFGAACGASGLALLGITSASAIAGATSSEFMFGEEAPAQELA